MSVSVVYVRWLSLLRGFLALAMIVPGAVGGAYLVSSAFPVFGAFVGAAWGAVLLPLAVVLCPFPKRSS